MLSKKRICSTLKSSKKRNHKESFLLRLYEILQESKEIIYWENDGKTLTINDIVEFSRTILPKYYKHSNFNSFVRQLNMYDFHKIKGENDMNRQSFVHEKFVKGITLEKVQKIHRKNFKNLSIAKTFSENKNKELSQNSYSTVTEPAKTNNFETINTLLNKIKKQEIQINELKNENKILNGKLSCLENSNKIQNNKVTNLENKMNHIIHYYRKNILFGFLESLFRARTNNKLMNFSCTNKNSKNLKNLVMKYINNKYKFQKNRFEEENIDDSKIKNQISQYNNQYNGQYNNQYNNQYNQITAINSVFSKLNKSPIKEDYNIQKSEEFCINNLHQLINAGYSVNDSFCDDLSIFDNCGNICNNNNLICGNVNNNFLNNSLNNQNISNNPLINDLNVRKFNSSFSLNKNNNTNEINNSLNNSNNNILFNVDNKSNNNSIIK